MICLIAAANYSHLNNFPWIALTVHVLRKSFECFYLSLEVVDFFKAQIVVRMSKIRKDRCIYQERD